MDEDSGYESCDSDFDNSRIRELPFRGIDLVIEIMEDFPDVFERTAETKGPWVALFCDT
jgi:hypothetical protein